MKNGKLLEISKFAAPEIIFGFGAISQAGESVLRLGAKKAFVVTDDGLIQTGWVEQVLRHLREVGLDYEVWSNITSNPKDYEVNEGASLYLKSECDAIAAVGGGSAIDAAKAIAVLATNGGKPQDFEGINKITRPLPPMVMVSTTAGSGSEVSQFAIIVDSARKIKMTIVSKSLIPDIAIIDPYLLYTKDARLTASTGVDALCHAIESYVSLAATPLTDVHALYAVQLVSNNLRESVACRTNLEAKKAMAMASLQAGLAFSNAILGATHAMTHQVDGLLDSHHGETNSILLPYVMEYNLIACAEKYARVAEALGVRTEGMSRWKAAEKSIRWVKNLFRDIGTPKTLSQMGLDENVIPQLAENALKDACLVTNPRDAGKEDLIELFKRAL
ncbi:1,3-propanediol dehydrogenase [Desulfohalotomaculum tongense]|uniref:iron-containing alcohol dehydrogenase n=1 Tax=Desulforadius tongensis TaxID=1216062 RepID=UPI0019598277|nr:iron-containing alcohol dehydrogenase [Desulforadius tongensis]MBM7853975.1 1,3-propanediol dehydrogenase [Desulforadius tongensis]